MTVVSRQKFGVGIFFMTLFLFVFFDNIGKNVPMSF